MNLGRRQHNREAMIAHKPSNFQSNNMGIGNSGPQQLQQQQQFQQANIIDPVTPMRMHTSPVPLRKLDTERRVEGGSRRQDLISGLLPAAIGLSSAGISPVGIFSNLLNAYATIDSKHDITGKLISGAASWFNPASTPDDKINSGDGDQETTSSSTTTTTTTAESSTTTLETTSPPTVANSNSDKPLTIGGENVTPANVRYVPTPANVRVRDRVSTFSYSSSGENTAEDEYVSLLKRIKSGIGSSSNSLGMNKKSANSNSIREEYDVVYDRGALVPPVRSNLNPDAPLRPKPPSEAIVQVSPSPPPNWYGDNENEDLRRYGVNNPSWFSQGLPSSTAGYGPDDFVVETVNLDKDFFYQFFTSKPMIIDTDVVTSTSVQVTYDNQSLLGKRGRGDSLSGLPEHLSSDTASSPATLPTVHLVTKPSEAPEILNNVSKFKRYHVPAEVRITHNLHVPKNRQVMMSLCIPFFHFDMGGWPLRKNWRKQTHWDLD